MRIAKTRGARPAQSKPGPEMSEHRKLVKLSAEHEGALRFLKWLTLNDYVVAKREDDAWRPLRLKPERIALRSLNINLKKFDLEAARAAQSSGDGLRQFAGLPTLALAEELQHAIEDGLLGANGGRKSIPLTIKQVARALGLLVDGYQVAWTFGALKASNKAAVVLCVRSGDIVKLLFADFNRSRTAIEGPAAVFDNKFSLDGAPEDPRVESAKRRETSQMSGFGFRALANGPDGVFSSVRQWARNADGIATQFAAVVNLVDRIGGARERDD